MNDDDWILYQSGEHDDNVCVQNKPKKLGISLAVQNLFKEILADDDSITAKKLLNRVTFLIKKNQKKVNQLKEEKYNIDLNLLPLLKQVLIKK